MERREKKYYAIKNSFGGYWVRVLVAGRLGIQGFAIGCNPFRQAGSTD
jgi:hypothetical protein